MRIILVSRLQAAMEAAAQANPSPPLAPLPRQAEGDRAIPSAALLAGQASVVIEHQGVRYVLRATRAGKLILTK
jgi:hemin uptake protein HemP